MTRATAHDFSEIRLRGEELRLFLTLGNFSERTEAMVNAGPAWTLRVGGKVVTIGGCFKLWEGVGEVWQVPSIEIYKHPFTFSRIIKKFIDSYARDYDRLQTASPFDEVHHRWHEFIGFNLEAKMKYFGPHGETYGLYSRIKGE